MADIPYGYHILNGQAVIDPDEAKRIKLFAKYYLSGDSIKKALGRAGIPRSHSCGERILSDPAYRGNRYYPAILDRKTGLQLLRERAGRARKNAHKAAAKRPETPPPETRFILTEEKDLPEWLREEQPMLSEPVWNATLMYNRIKPFGENRV